MNPQNSRLVEFLRFGSSIPGGYWGCCAGDIVQCFKSDPDERASCQSVNGDGGEPETNNKGEFLYFGPTNRDLFMQRLRNGTFGGGEFANHFFIAVLTQEQICCEPGSLWLPILKECGFEFIRTVANSVYTGSDLKTSSNVSEEKEHEPCGCGDPYCTLGMNEDYDDEGDSLNYVFGLFRGIANGAPADAFTPPVAWSALPSIKRESWEYVTDRKELTQLQAKVDTDVWNRIGPAKLLTEAELVEKGAPVILAGQRSANPQELKEIRDKRNENKKQETSLRASPTPQATG
jgi:hypothetical protein